MKTKRVPTGAILAQISRERQSEGVTPPIDQRPSSFLLSFLQFVNFLNRGLWARRCCSLLAAQHLPFELDCRVRGRTRGHSQRRRVSLNRSFMDCFWNSSLSARRRGKKNAFGASYTSLRCSQSTERLEDVKLLLPRVVVIHVKSHARTHTQTDIEFRRVAFRRNWNISADKSRKVGAGPRRSANECVWLLRERARLLN